MEILTRSISTSRDINIPALLHADFISCAKHNDYIHFIATREKTLDPINPGRHTPRSGIRLN